MIAVFFQAQWSHVSLFSYAVPPEILTPYLPPSLMPDMHNGQAFVTLTAVKVSKARLFGFPWMALGSFPYLGLHVHVRHKQEHGLFAIRELVGSPAIATIGRMSDKPYMPAALRADVHYQGNAILVDHQLTLNGKIFRLSLVAGKTARRAEPTSDNHFFQDQHWGFGKDRSGKLVRYAMSHPIWDIHQVRTYHMNFDWNAIYGAEWAFLNNATPHSIILGTGSQVILYRQRRVRDIQEAPQPEKPLTAS